MPGSATGGENWFFVREGRRIGPFDRGALIAELLGQGSPEAVLVWRTGLPAWAKAGSLDELKGELPPPIPGILSGQEGLRDRAVLESEDQEASASFVPPLPQDAPVSDGDFAGDAGRDDESEPAGSSDAAKRRRRRRQRGHASHPARPPRYVLPLVLLFLAVMVGLWFLLRRMNEAPPGQILQQGDGCGASECRRGESRA
jgi:hypothetical protein